MVSLRGGMSAKMATAPTAAKRKSQDDGAPQKKKQKKVREDDADLDVEAGLNRAFERMDGQLLADHIAKKTTRFGTDLSTVELSDLYISATVLKDTTSWQKPRTQENFPEFLEAFSENPEKLQQAPKALGSPHTILVAGAGQRAADLVRAVRTFQQKGNPVAKLFAKHFKLEEQVSFLKKTRTGIAVGTPQRLMDLIDDGALNITSLRRIVIDASHIDQKKRGITDMKETMMPLAKLLSRKELKEKYENAEKSLDLIFY
ncbi:U3-containing 90S pre-ribosomal complex subunit-domain containing protein [Podospora didyma]|uniref:U3-containing 90S pre-ribosomal complex subunit-domain containing protein n=1 Tax=Podospora didyma TaxID=330526 RepID=A0AAE0P6W8_9PEZI|nr:U3-containing 90S pre-ribosomal complex subunit-domain containing protein [Podospora didyma]